MIQSEIYLSPSKKVDQFNNKNKYSKDLIDMHKLLEEKDQQIIKLQKQLSEATRQIISNKNEKSEWEKKFQKQEDYIQKCQKMIIQYESLLQQNKSSSQDKKMQLPSIQNSQANSELKLQGSQIQTQKKKNKFDSENESFKENKSQASRKQVEKKHFETSTESISFQDGTTPRNFNHDEQLENRLIIDSAQKMTKSECKPAKKEFFFDEQRNNLSYKVPGMNRSLIQQTNQSGPDNQQQNQFQHMYNGSESLNARDRNRKQISKGNLRNSLQDININQNTNFQGNKLNNLIPINNQFAQFIQGNYEKNIKNDNIFSRQNQYQYQNQNQLKAKLLENQSYGQIKSTPDLSLIKLPISKLQKVESKEIKRRINIKVEQQFLN